MRKISEMLQDARIEKNLSITDVVKSIRIKKDFLIAIEDGRYHDLPSESYALGFVKNYASFVGIDKTKAAALFRREYEGQQAKLIPTFKSQDKKITRKFIFSPRSFLILLGVVLIVGYILYQYNSFLFGPKLEVTQPTEGLTINENIVEVEGTTDPYASVSVNSDEVYVKLDGSFRKTLYLFEGKRQISIIAKSRNGKETKKVVNVIVR